MSLKTMKNARYQVLRLIGKGRMSEVYLITLLCALAKESGDRFSTVSAFDRAFEQAIQLLAVPAMVIPVTKKLQDNGMS